MVFEDILDGIRAAKEAGILTIAVADVQSRSNRAAITALADRYIESFDELADTFPETADRH